MRHLAEFREDRSNRSGDMADFRFFKMAAVRHLDLFYACWDHTRRLFGGLLVVIGAVISIVCKF